jgi:CDP-diacylglycerol--glycerol-3-phosphate 3-phosphatidyltransferase
MALHVQSWVYASLLFFGAVITDVLDGYLARRWHQQTFLGACLDPIADKVLMISLFFTLMHQHHPLVPVWFCWLVLGKETVQLAGAGCIFLTKRELFVCPSVMGKLSMFLQTCFVFIVFLAHVYPLSSVFYKGLLASVGFFLGGSLVQYVVVGFGQLLDNRKRII